MSAPISAAPPRSLPSHEAQATALWAYIASRNSRLRLEDVVEIVRRLAIEGTPPPKQLARQLRHALDDAGVKLKHSQALQAASRLLGHGSWFEARQAAAGEGLAVHWLDRSETEFAESWTEVGQRLCVWYECQLPAAPQKVAIVVRQNSIVLTVPRGGTAAENARDATSWPVASIRPPEGDAAWVNSAAIAMETLRRRIEEQHHGLLDGVEVLRLCARASNDQGDLAAFKIGPLEVANSELILSQEDNPLWPDGFEIARGDELTCWHQLLLSLRDDSTGRPPAAIDVRVHEEDGAWHIGSARFVWTLSTVRPNDFIPGLHMRQLGFDDAHRLKRRFDIARRVLGEHFTHHEQSKRLHFLGETPEAWRINQHEFLLALNKQGMTWESFCDEHLGERRELQARVPIGVVLAACQALDLEDPNRLIARPNRTEMVRADDDEVLRVLLPRIQHVTYRNSRILSQEQKDAVKEAIEQLSASIMVRNLPGTFDAKGEMPYLVYASDGEELRARLEEHGLVIYAGVIPRLMPIPAELLPQTNPPSWPWALGHSLYLDIDVAGDAQ